jgi:acetate kinase
MQHVVLCLNSGSSSLKFALYLVEDWGEARLARGVAERIGLPGGRLWIEGSGNEMLDVRRDFTGHDAAAESLAVAAKDLHFPFPAAAGHRVVHGGPRHSSAERLNARLLAELKKIGALAAVLNGVDDLIFTGGIGERAAPVRAEVCHGLEHLGIAVDEELNAVHAEVISRPGSACAVRVIPTNEDLMIARHTRALLFSTATTPVR